MTRRRRSIVAITGGLLFLAGLVLAGCGGGGGGGETPRLGNTSGYVQDISTQQGVAGASISIGGKSASSGSDGAYRITGIPVGPQPVTISAAGYQSYSGTAQISEGENIGVNFSLTPIGGPSITLTQPDGGEAWQADDAQDIEWDSQDGIHHVHLQYSPNGGTTWREIISSTADTGSYTWTVPQAITAKALVIATAEDAADSPLAEDISDAVFSMSAPSVGRYLYLRSDAEGAGAGQVMASIYVTDATGIAGADITLTFDASVLTATGATTATLTQGFSVVSNPTPGAIVISFASAQGIGGGSGALINVQFTVAAGAAGRASALTLASATLYSETAQPIAHNKISGLFTAR